MGQNDKATLYMRQNNINTDYVSLIRNTLTTPNPNAPQLAYKLAKDLLMDSSQNVDVHKIAAIFLEFSQLQEMTSICFEFMKENRKEDGQW